MFWFLARLKFVKICVEALSSQISEILHFSTVLSVCLDRGFQGPLKYRLQSRLRIASPSSHQCSLSLKLSQHNSERQSSDDDTQVAEPGSKRSLACWTMPRNETGGLQEGMRHWWKKLSGSVDSRMTNLEQLVQDQWRTFTKMDGRTVQPDGREAAITRVEHRIKMAVQRDADERCKNCVSNEDKITTNTIEVLRSEMELSASHALHLHVTLLLHQLHFLATLPSTTCSFLLASTISSYPPSS